MQKCREGSCNGDIDSQRHNRISVVTIAAQPLTIQLAANQPNINGG